MLVGPAHAEQEALQTAAEQQQRRAEEQRIDLDDGRHGPRTGSCSASFPRSRNPDRTADVRKLCWSSALAGNDVVKLACPMKLNTGQIQAQPQAVPIFSLTITCLRLGCQQQKWPLMPPRLAGQERSEPC